MREQRHQRAADRRSRHVARIHICRGDPVQRGDHGVELCGERVFQQVAPCRGLLDREVVRAPAHVLPQGLQRGFARSVVQQRAHHVHEVVAAGAVHAPVIGQALAGAKDLLHDEPGGTGQ